jgi:hypothetical protein
MFYAPMKYLSSNHIAIWSMYERCSSMRSFTSWSPNSNTMNICWIPEKLRRKSRVIHSDFTNIDRITNRSPGSEIDYETESFLYGLYCDTIRTQIPNWTESMCCYFLLENMKPARYRAGAGFSAGKIHCYGSGAVLIKRQTRTCNLVPLLTLAL